MIFSADLNQKPIGIVLISMNIVTSVYSSLLAIKKFLLHADTQTLLQLIQWRILTLRKLP